jgi:hypothetical protein
MRKNIPLGVGLLLVVIIGCWITFVQPIVVSRKARQEAIMLMSELSLGQTHDEVRNHCKSDNYRHLKLNEYSTNEWIVSTPLQLGGGNWIVRIDFTGSNVSALKIRTEDDPRARPLNAPADKHI